LARPQCRTERTTARGGVGRARVMRAGRRRPLQRRILAEYRLLHPLQVRSRLDPQLTVQQAARPAEYGQRLALPPGPVHSQHELAVERFMIRIAGDQSLQLRDQVLMPAELKG